MIKHITKFANDKAGGLVIEAALIFPFLITLGLGVADASYMLVQNHKLETQLAMAGNYLSKTRAPAQHETQAKNLACGGALETTTKCIIPNWTVSDIQISYGSVDNAELESGYEYRGGQPVTIVTVTSDISYTGFGVLSSVFGKSIRLTGSYEERLIGT